MFAIEAGAKSFVVKRARERLDTSLDWFADTGRIATEAKALEAAGSLTPGAVPNVLDLDTERATMIIERAPSSWTDWRSSLLDGEAGNDVAAWLGEMLARWHRGTAGSAAYREGFSSLDQFEELRLAPFFATTAAAHPDLEGEISAAADRLRRERVCLVHGDFSPKNVLHGDGGSWVLDWEVAHYGAPVFDLAFMLCHLALKAIHRPADAKLYRGLSAEFLATYVESRGLVSPEDPGLAVQIACLLLARVDGRSPATYLSPSQRVTVRSLSLELLRGKRQTGPVLGLLEVNE